VIVFNKKWLISILIIVGVGGFLVWRYGSHNFNLPMRGITTNTSVLLDDQGQIITNNNDQNNAMKREIMITNGIRHIISLEEIKEGGPPKDGIPSIDDPKFVSINQANEFLDDAEPGIALSLQGENRFYPYQIMVWHEIVNDKINGQPILVTYCPLCLSGIVFDPLVAGERVAFGTSGKLWQSNLLMYDRKTESLYSQILGEAVVGEMTGNKLKVLPSDQIRYGDWKRINPTGQVLSRETGFVRSYGQDPYGNYYTTPGSIFKVRASDDRLADKDFVLGVVIEGQAKAYYPPAIKAKGEIEDNFAGKTIIAKYESDIDAVRLFEKDGSGKLTRINPFGNFWFSWVAAHPDTDLYK
jgi:hypothetical protein